MTRQNPMPLLVFSIYDPYRWSYRIHTGIHIGSIQGSHTGIHTATAAPKPGFVVQLTTISIYRYIYIYIYIYVYTLGVSFATRTWGSEPVSKTGPARRSAGRECWQTDTHLRRTFILGVATQCNASRKILAQNTRHNVARCKTAQPSNARFPCHANLGCHQLSGAHGNRKMFAPATVEKQRPNLI